MFFVFFKTRVKFHVNRILFIIQWTTCNIRRAIAYFYFYFILFCLHYCARLVGLGSAFNHVRPTFTGLSGNIKILIISHVT